MEIKDIINQRKEELNLTFADIAKACNVSEATVSRWASGEIGDMRRSRIASLAKILKISPSLLIGDLDDEQVLIPLSIPTKVVRIPIYANASCGTGSFVDDDIIEIISLPIDLFKNPNLNMFGQYAEGDSMIGVGINDGDLIIFEDTNLLENGQIGCFCIEDNIATCKRFSIDSKKNIFLLSANEKYPPIPISIENDCFRVVGRFITKISKEK